jgi:hypothetical protein
VQHLKCVTLYTILLARIDKLKDLFLKCSWDRWNGIIKGFANTSSCMAYLTHWKTNCNRALFHNFKHNSLLTGEIVKYDPKQEISKDLYYFLGNTLCNFLATASHFTKHISFPLKVGIWGHRNIWNTQEFSKHVEF